MPLCKILSQIVFLTFNFTKDLRVCNLLTLHEPRPYTFSDAWNDIRLGNPHLYEPKDYIKVFLVHQSWLVSSFVVC